MSSAVMVVEVAGAVLAFGHRDAVETTAIEQATQIPIGAHGRAKPSTTAATSISVGSLDHPCELQ
jgi:hypothetical protein